MKRSGQIVLFLSSHRQIDLMQNCKRLEENRDTIKSFGVRRLGIFGSYTRGEQTESSDMDFLVVFEKKPFAIT